MSRWDRDSRRSTQSTRIMLFPLFIVLVAFAISCEPSMPDDLPSLITLLNDNSETVAVAALNKIDAKYGRSGVLRALEEGGESAQVMAANRLANYPGEDVERALRLQLRKQGDVAIRGSALFALREVGTINSLADVRRLKTDPAESIALAAKDTEAAIEARAAVKPRTKDQGPRTDEAPGTKH